jgi:hypothetical protein
VQGIMYWKTSDKIECSDWLIQIGTAPKQDAWEYVYTRRHPQPCFFSCGPGDDTITVMLIYWQWDDDDDDDDDDDSYVLT